MSGNRGIVFIGMETSGALRTRFQAQGHFVVSADTLPAEDGAGFDQGADGGHLQMDAFEALGFLAVINRWPSLAVFHITCTWLTGSAEWAFKDPDFARYPGVGYHQKLKPGTLFGAERRAARERAKDEFRCVRQLPIQRKVVENPVGALSSICKPSQIIQPYEHGDDASKKTCLWFFDENGDEASDMRLPVDPARRVPGRLVRGTNPRGKSNLHLGYVTNPVSDLFETQNLRHDGCYISGVSSDPDPENVTWVERWSNQTDSGQNRLTPGEERWKDRSRTFPGIADTMAAHWSQFA